MMEDEPSNTEKNDLLFREENKIKIATIKGLSITKALVIMGFDDWKELEPGNYFRYKITS